MKSKNYDQFEVEDDIEYQFIKIFSLYEKYRGIFLKLSYKKNYYLKTKIELPLLFF